RPGGRVGPRGRARRDHRQVRDAPLRSRRVGRPMTTAPGHPLPATEPVPSPWPPEAVAAHRAAGLWTGEDFGAFLRTRAERFAGRTAVVDAAGARITYAQLDARADAIAAHLIAAGVRRGARVMVQVPN